MAEKFTGAAHHELADKYVLQKFTDGQWKTIRECTKQGGANSAVKASKKDGFPYRVYNVTKQKVYMECG